MTDSKAIAQNNMKIFYKNSVMSRLLRMILKANTLHYKIYEKALNMF